MTENTAAVRNGVRGFFVNGGPLVMLSGFEGVNDVEEFELAVIEVVNEVLDAAEANPDVLRKLAQEQQQQAHPAFDNARAAGE